MLSNNFFENSINFYIFFVTIKVSMSALQSHKIYQRHPINLMFFLSSSYSFFSLHYFTRMKFYSWPQSATRTLAEVLPDWDPKDSTFFTTSIPSTTDPKTTCFPSNQEVLAVHKKNCEPLVFGPALAMERIPGPVCFNEKFSSSNLFP